MIDGQLAYQKFSAYIREINEFLNELMFFCNAFERVCACGIHKIFKQQIVLNKYDIFSPLMRATNNERIHFYLLLI